jgi:hypothetical protein
MIPLAKQLSDDQIPESQYTPILAKAFSEEEAPPVSGHLAHALTTADGMGGPVFPAPPQVKLDTDPLHQIEGHEQNRLNRDYEKDANPWGSPTNHPGVMGKIAHALNHATGGDTRRQWEEGAIAKNIEGLVGEKSQNQERGAQARNLEAESGLHGAQATAAELVPASQQEADTYGIPIGTPLNAAIRGALAKQSGINTSKEKIATENDSTKMSVAELQQAARDAAAAGKPQPHIITMQGDRPHVMERDPQTKAYTIDRGIAPPNYAQVLPEMLATKTTEMLGPDNIQHRYQFNPETHAFDIDMGAAPTGQAAHQIFQGAAIEQLGPQVIKDIQDNRKILGNISSYYKQWLAGTPVSDPNAARLMTELMSFAATQPALHAFRSTNAMEAFEKMVGGLAKDPDSTIASIQGLMLLPKTFTNLAKPPAGKGGTQPAQGGGKPPDADVQVPGADGKMYWGNSKTKQLYGEVKP